MKRFFYTIFLAIILLGIFYSFKNSAYAVDCSILSSNPACGKCVIDPWSGSGACMKQCNPGAITCSGKEDLNSCWWRCNAAEGGCDNPYQCCYPPSPTPTNSPPSCNSLTVQPVTVMPGESITLKANVGELNGSVTKVDFYYGLVSEIDGGAAVNPPGGNWHPLGSVSSSQPTIPFAPLVTPNVKTGKSCDQICQGYQGRSCLSVGTDTGGTNGSVTKFNSTGSEDGSCDSQTGGWAREKCNVAMNAHGQMPCDWTNCRCSDWPTLTTFTDVSWTGTFPGTGGAYYFIANVFDAQGLFCSGNPKKPADVKGCSACMLQTTVVTPSPTPSESPTPSATPTSTPTSTPTPTPLGCGNPCSPDNNECPEECPFCPVDNSFCVGPSSTPTPTQVPCNGPCTNSNECDINCPLCSTDHTCRVPCGDLCTNSNECDLSCPICTADNKCLAASPTPTKVPCTQPCTNSLECDINCPLCSTDHTCRVPCGDLCTNSNECDLSCPICTADNKCLAASPTPTATPIPPTATPTATVTPTPEPYCLCDSMEYTGSPVPGGTMSFTTWGRIPDYAHNNSGIQSMIYRVWNGRPESQSVPPDAAGPVTVPAQGPVTVGADYRYSTTWNWQIPSTVPTSGYVDYYFNAEIKCVRPRSTADSGSNLVQANTAVLGTTEEKSPGFFASILRFFGSLLGISPSVVTPSPLVPTPTSSARLVPLAAEALSPTPTQVMLPPSPTMGMGGYCASTVLAPSGVHSDQLGTFTPNCACPTPAIIKTCTWTVLRIYYGDDCVKTP